MEIYLHGRAEESYTRFNCNSQELHINSRNAANLRASLGDLVHRNLATQKIDEGPAIPVINHVIDTELARLPAIANTLPEARGQLSDLDAFLHEMRCEM